LPLERSFEAGHGPASRIMKQPHELNTPPNPLRAISIAVSKDEALVSVTLVGRPGPDAIIRMLTDVDALIAQDRGLRVLIDETRLAPAWIGPRDLQRFVETWKGAVALRAARMAIFTPNLAMYGLNRMFQGMADETKRIGVFHDGASARVWLGGPQEPS
jgi:hypothetical protein